MNEIAVLLVDDHTVVREGLRALLEAEEDITVVGEAADGREAVRLAKKCQPDVIVMDVAMPLMNGMEATRQILKDCACAAVLVLSSYGDSEWVDKLLETGAAGYLLKQSAADELSKAIREVRRGRKFLSGAIMRERERDRASQERLEGRKRELTARETEVLQLVAKGLSNKMAALELGVSVKTIEKHRQQVMNKLNIHETAGLTRYALSRGMIEPARPDFSGRG